jgi:hypothetical protein
MTHVPPGVDPALATAYRGTDYVVELPGGEVVLQIGEAVPERLTRELEAEGADCWAFVTAWNPESRVLDDHENQRRQAELVAALREAGYACWPGEGRGRDGFWPPEASVLVPGLGEAEAREWGQRFGQNAVVVGAATGMARLAWC